MWNCPSFVTPFPFVYTGQQTHCNANVIILGYDVASDGKMVISGTVADGSTSNDCLMVVPNAIGGYGFISLLSANSKYNPFSNYR
jgi:hypothetical protein